MKQFAVFGILALLGWVSPQESPEAKKKRLGELIAQMMKIQKEAAKLVEELSGGDPDKAQAIMQELME
ncbi:MAG TPA: hypothetical protein VEN81_06420, partial [Planctomycetota bacterium]|nr:hypothetical protein [Planctomycetota bacterium]